MSGSSFEGLKAQRRALKTKIRALKARNAREEEIARHWTVYKVLSDRLAELGEV